MLHSTQVSLGSELVGVETWPPPPRGPPALGHAPTPHHLLSPVQCGMPVAICHHAFPTWPTRLLYITCWLHGLLGL